MNIHSDLFNLAFYLAKVAHEGQLRKTGEPFITHPISVSNKVQHLGDEYAITAILHDTVEDTHIDIDTIDNVFGETISEAVWSVTRIVRDDFKEKYWDFIKRSKNNKIGRQVKIADIEHNLSTIEGFSDENEKIGLKKRWTKALEYLKTEGE